VTEWFYNLNGKAFGPLSPEQLKQLADAGQIQPQTEVRRSQDSRWFKAEQVPGLIAAAKGSAVASAKKRAKPAGQGSAPPIARALPPVAVALGTPLAATPAAGLPPAQVPLGQVPTGKVPTGKVPTGVPVGQAIVPPVAASPAIPVGMPVAAPSNIPMGMPIAPAPPAFNFAAAGAASAPSFGTATSDDDEVRPAKKGNHSLLLVSVLGGACVAVAVVGGLLLYMRSSAVEKETAIAAATDDVPPAADANPLANPTANPEANPEANPTLSVAAMPESAPAAGSASNPATASTAAADSAAQLLRLKGIASWSPLHLPHMFTSKSVRITIANAWLAADETGRRVAVKSAASPAAAPAVATGVPAVGAEVVATVAVKPAESVKPAEAPAASELALAEPAKYLFVEVKIVNTSAKVLTYQGWNAAAEAGAILASADKILPLAPRASTPSAQRQAAVDLAPGQTINDVLVFAAPADSVETLRLALPQASLFANSKGYCAVEIPRQMLLSEPAPAAINLAGGAVDPVMGNLKPSTGAPFTGADLRKKIESDTAMLQQEAAAAKAAAQPAVAPLAAPAAEAANKLDKPLSGDELRKKIESDTEMLEQKPDAAKPGQPAQPVPAVKP
jgi:hypothetical protein